MTLEQRIIERIQREGALTFAEYMRMALYEPGYGYYVTGAAKIGWEGDYFTSSDVSALFAHCMGRQLRQLWEHLQRPTPFLVLEQGAGRGDLAQSIRAWSECEAPDLHTALDYRTEDINAGQDAIHAGAGEGYHVILSNELVDAFPVHRVQVHQGQLYEIYVDEKDGHLYEVLDEPSKPEVADYLDHYKIPWRSFGDGWQAEINLAAQHWMQATTARLYKTPRAAKGRGFILVIDYGDKARGLYTQYRRTGTLACYYRHQLTERPLVRPGEQDITAHINFSALIEEGRGQGLRLHTYTTQRQWLENTGIYEEMDALRKTEQYAAMDTERASDRGQIALFKWYNLRNRAAALTDPAGMGNFKVLIMRRQP